MAEKVKFVLEVDSKGAITSMKKLETSTKQSTEKMKKSFLSLDKVVKGTVILAIVGMALKMKDLASSTIDYADSLHKMNMRLGISVNSLDKLRQIGALAGVEFGTINNALGIMARNLDMAKTGSNDASRALKEVGVKISDIAALNPQEQFITLSEAIMKIEDPSLRAAKAQQILGRSGLKLISMFPNLRKVFNDTTSAFTQDRVKQMADFNDTMQMFGEVARALTITYLPPLLGMLTSLQPLFKSMADALGMKPIDAQVNDVVSELNENMAKLKKLQDGNWLDNMVKDKDDPFVQGMSSRSESIDYLTKKIEEQRKELKKLMDIQTTVSNIKNKPGINSELTTDPKPNKKEIEYIKKLNEIIKESIQRNAELTKSGRDIELYNLNKHYTKMLTQVGAAYEIRKQIEENLRLEKLAINKRYDDIEAEETLKIRKEAIDKGNAMAKDSWILKHEMAEEFRKKEAEAEQEAVDAKADQIKQINEMIADDMTDSLMEFIDGTKSAGDAFKDFASRVLNELSAMILQHEILNGLQKQFGLSTDSSSSSSGFISSIFGGIKDLFGGSSTSIVGGGSPSLAGRAGGGPVQSDTAYMVGENGPEIFSPDSNGSIVPNHQLDLSSSNNPTQNITNINIQTMDSKSFTDFARSNPDAFSSVMSDLANRGNSSFRQAIKKATR